MFPRLRSRSVKDARRPLVYSSGTGRICPKCGWPQTDCRCSSALVSSEPVPPKITARLRVEKRGSGKVVTVIDGLPRNDAFLQGLARELKKSCGAGGRVVRSLDLEGRQIPAVEIQGDHRERLRDVLHRKGWIVKG